MTREHHIKIDKEYADSVLCGDKAFEIRNNDRGYQKDDIVTFQVMDGCLCDEFHELNKKRYKITYVFSGFGLKEGWVVFGIQEAGK